MDLRTRYPQLHLLVAEIFTQKDDYPSAIVELETYLQLTPHSKDTPQVEERLAKLRKLNSSVSVSEKPDPK